MFGGGCAFWQPQPFRKTRPPPSSATCCTDLVKLTGAEGDVRYSVATATAGETVVQDRAA